MLFKIFIGLLLFGIALDLSAIRNNLADMHKIQMQTAKDANVLTKRCSCSQQIQAIPTEGIKQIVIYPEDPNCKE